VRSMARCWRGFREDDTTTPYQLGGYDHRVRTQKGLQYPIYERRKRGAIPGSVSTACT